MGHGKQAVVCRIYKEQLIKNGNMAEINFQRFEMWDGIAHRKKTTVDAREGIADLIYRNTVGMRGHSLAHKVFESEGATEYSEEEARTLCEIVERLGTGPAIDGLHEQLNQQNSKEAQP